MDVQRKVVKKRYSNKVYELLNSFWISTDSEFLGILSEIKRRRKKRIP
jgi:hypothetical protein